MKTKYLIVIMVLVLASCSKREETKVIAHRGYWDTEGSAENSIASLVAADKLGCYAAEFDVWMTKDHALIVNHDSEINGKKITETSWTELKKMELPNGEPIPLLKDYLLKAKDLKIRLVLELKGMDDDKEVIAARIISNILKNYNLIERTDIISFSLGACKQFIALMPETKVFYLNGDMSPEDLNKIGFAGIDYQDKVLRENPKWIKEAHKLGMQVNVRTVDDAEDITYFIENKVDYITTNKPQLAMDLIKKLSE